MSDCCNTPPKTKHPKKLPCPKDGKLCGQVSSHTILHHLAQPWAKPEIGPNEQNESYYFCGNPDCDVVYFNSSNKLILSSELRTKIGIKLPEQSNALLCYCFGVSREDFKNNPSIRDYVKAQTKAKLCACDIRNPSGRCCLKDFSKP